MEPFFSTDNTLYKTQKTVKGKGFRSQVNVNLQSKKKATKDEDNRESEENDPRAHRIKELTFFLVTQHGRGFKWPFST